MMGDRTATRTRRVEVREARRTALDRSRMQGRDSGACTRETFRAAGFHCHTWSSSPSSTPPSARVRASTHTHTRVVAQGYGMARPPRRAHCSDVNSLVATSPAPAPADTTQRNQAEVFLKGLETTHTVRGARPALLPRCGCQFVFGSGLVAVAPPLRSNTLSVWLPC